MAEKLYEVRIEHNVRLPTRDGLTLSANLFLPVPREPGERFPAILEMIPYRKDDWRSNADRSRMEYFARRGYAGCRLDVRGTGSSQGIAWDEYTEAETQDGFDAVEWLAAQPWCSGQVGMWGISYGGFTAIQVAKLQPPHLKAIIPVYATDDRYADDVHYLGGCLLVSELAQYALGMVGMNALPPVPEHAGADWAADWKARLEQTPPWILEWFRRQTDGAYWRRGSLAPDYDRIRCAVFQIAGWMDGYTSPALRIQAACRNAPRKTLIGNWAHLLPDDGYPGPNLDYLHEMVRFFDYWLKGTDNGVMAEPALTFFRREYTPPEAFPAALNGEWVSAPAYPVEGASSQAWHLGAESLSRAAPESAGRDDYAHQPAHGTRSGVTWGAGGPPTGLARDLRPDESLMPVYTSAPLAEPLDILGFPEAVLYLSSTAPVAHVVVRLSDVHPDGTSAYVTGGVLNLTHRVSHTDPQPLAPGEVFEVRVSLKAAGYRFRAGHRLRVSIASAWWPLIWPSAYRAVNSLHRGPAHPSRLILPVINRAAGLAPAPEFKTTPPDVESFGSETEEPAVWQILEDVIRQTTTVTLADGGTTRLPGGARSLYSGERIEMTAHHTDPANVRLSSRVVYRLSEHGHETSVVAAGTVRSTASDFHVDVELRVELNGNDFFRKSWLETIPRRLV